MNKHPHYYTIRAFADGWDIESYSPHSNRWEVIPSPSFFPNYKYRVVPDEDGWLPWFGEDRTPDGVTENQKIVFINTEFSRRDSLFEDLAEDIQWHRLTGRYRIVQEKKTDPYAKLKVAAADPTKQIRVGAGYWRDACEYRSWDLQPEEYEIRDKPKTKKVKLFAYLTRAGCLSWYSKQLDFDGWKRVPPEDDGWIRVPSEDKEIEVEE